MMKTRFIATMLLGGSMLASASHAVPAWAAEPAAATQAADKAQAPAEVQVTFLTLMTALQKDDYAAFVAQGNQKFKDAVTPDILKGVNAQLGPRMEKGYDTTFATDLKQQGVQEYIWKISFKDGGDDYLITLSVTDGKVASFIIN